MLCGSVNPITRAQLREADMAGFAHIHLSPEEKLTEGFFESEAGAARIADRLNYLNKLAEFINAKTYDYLIIAGDWNTKESASDHPNLLNFCQSIDASPVNGGILGWFGTCTQEELPRTYDNIIVSNNIRIDDVDCDPMLTPSGQIHSDHTPVVAEISFM